MAVRILLVLVASVFAYGIAVRNGFLFDDVAQVYELKPAEGPGDWIASAADPWWPNYKKKFIWRPVTRMFILLEKALAGSEGEEASASGYHLVSVGLHGLACVLAMFLAAKLGAGTRSSLFAGLALAVHPLRGEAIHQIVGQAELLAAIAMTFGLLLHATREDGHFSKKYLIAQVLVYAFALGAKEHAILYPFYLVLVGKTRGFHEELRRYRWMLAGLAGVAIIYLIARAAILGGLAETSSTIPEYENILAHYGFAVRIPVAMGVFGYFVSRLIFPVGISPDYSMVSLPVQLGWFWGMTWLGIAVSIVILVAIAMPASRRSVGRPAIMFLAAYWFIGNLFFTHGVLFALRLLYWPMVPAVVAVAVGYSRWRDGRRLTEKAIRWCVMAGTSVIILWSSVTWSNSRAWRTAMDFAFATLEQFPRSWRAHHNLSREYYAIKDMESGYKHACLATTIAPNEPRSWDNRGVIAMFIPGKEQDAEQSLLEAIRLKPELDLPYQHLANFMYMQGRKEEARKYDAKFREMSAKNQASGGEADESR